MSQDKKVINRILFSRAQIVAFGFALVIFTGTVLLMLQYLPERERLLTF